MVQDRALTAHRSASPATDVEIETDIRTLCFVLRASSEQPLRANALSVSMLHSALVDAALGARRDITGTSAGIDDAISSVQRWRAACCWTCS